MSLPYIRPRGTDLVDEAGKITKVVGMSDFAFFTRWLMRDGPHALCGPRLDEWDAIKHDAGFDQPLALRVFRCAAPPNPFAINPADHPDYFEQAAACTDYAASRGYYLDWTAGDAQIVFPSADPYKLNPNGPQGFTQHINDFTARVCLGRSNAWFSTLNEPFKNGNILPPVPQWDPAYPILRDSGNFGNYRGDDPNSWPFADDLDVIDFHNSRDVDGWLIPKWLFKIPESASVLLTVVKKPLIFKEPIGFDETDQPGRRSNSSQFAELLGAVGVEFANGVYLHTQNGATGDKLGPVQRDCAVAFLRGAKGGMA